MRKSGSQGEREASHYPKPADEPERAEADANAPKAYDWRTGTELSRDSFHQLRAHCERLASVLGRIIGAYLDTRASVEMVSVEPATFDQYTDSLTDLSAAGLVQIAEHLPEIIWQMDSSLTGTIIGRMLGGAPTALDRPPSRLEASLLGRFIQELVDVWATVWERLSQYGPIVTEVVLDSAELQTRGGDQQVVRVLMRAQVGEQDGTMNVCLPVATVQRLLSADDRRGRPRERNAAVVLGDAAGQVRVPVSVVVHHGTMSLRQAMGLRPGDIIPLRKPLDAPVTLAVRGRPKFLAQAGLRQGHLAARLLAPTVDFAP